MAGSTPNLGLYLPGGGSTGTWTPDEVADIDPLNQNFQKIDAFAGTVGVQTSRNQQFYGPASAISSVTGMKLGDTYQESDGNKILWKYDGTNWVTNEGGMYLLRPTTFAGCTVDATGTIIPTVGSTQIDVDSIFTDRFRSYEIKYVLEMPSSFNHTFRFRKAGSVIAATTEYNNQRLTSSATSVSGDNVSAAFWDLTTGAGNVHAGSLTLLNPRTSSAKFMEGRVRTHGGANPLEAFVAGINGGAAFLTPLDGFRITLGPAQTAPTILITWFKIYGLA